MNILIEIFKRSKKFLMFLLAIGLINSILNTGILMFINSYCNHSEFLVPKKYSWVLFLTMLIISLILNQKFRAYLIRITNELLVKQEMLMLDKIRKASYESFERVGNEKVYAAIEDAKFLGRIPEVFVFSFNSIIVIICCLIFLFIKSYVGGLIILGIVLLMGVFFAVRAKIVTHNMHQLRDLRDEYLKNINDLVLGFKELKMSQKKNENMYTKYISKNRLKWKKLGIETGIKFNNNEITGNYTWFIVIGIILFVLPNLGGFSNDIGTSFIIITLYLMTPVAYLVISIQDINNVKISSQRLSEFDKLLNAEIETEDIGKNVHSNFEFVSLVFKDLHYKYNHNGKKDNFQLGPVNLSFKKGEITFITGGNGSGKSTFINLLTCLYKPVSGDIYLNGEAISVENYEKYISCFSAIFTNNYLFNHNYEDIDFIEKDEQIKEYLDKMKITNVVRFNSEDKIFENQLSKGQQKRLAMIYALLEERDILVLDEWAAEQDPFFRAYFYQELLPEIKAMGKTIIAVTHDDAYFNCADRIIKFDFGTVKSDKIIEKKSEILN